MTDCEIAWTIYSDFATTMSYGTKAASRLAGKVALITGASSGIGEAIARELAEASNGDMRLVLTARRKDRLQKLADDLKGLYDNIKVHVALLDVSKLETIEPFVKNLPEEFGDIDILVNNAGLALGRDPVGEISTSDIATMFDTNVLGLITMTQAVLPIFKKKNSGDFFMLGSIAGRDAYPGGGIYCPTKASVRSFTLVLRKELISTKIRVMEIDPGQVETDFSLVRFRNDKQKAKDVYEGTEPLVATDIAEIVVFALTRRQNTVVAETLVFPNDQAGASLVYRKQ